MKKLIFFFALIGVMAFNNALAQTEVASGTCGDNLTWVLTEDSVLTISGTGAMTDYNWNTMPWYSNRTAIKTAVIENGVTTIGDYTFCNCTGLTSVTIPNSVTSIIIGNNVFAFCRSLTSIDVDGNNIVYSSENGILFDKAKTTLLLYPASKTDTTYTIPSSVTTIGLVAFWNCILTSVTIPKSVINIEDYVFQNCLSLTSVINLNPVPVEISTNVFSNVNKTACTLKVSTSAVSAYQAADVWKEFNVVGGAICNTGIVETLQATSLQVYPNPTTGQLTINN